ncbi:class I SAM-dependent methyltransferase [Nonomuraea sp. MG754425]|uniref:class I SAM-dependent DNA methyltransferase n=1 Tax=Nonomuraea sp. MG754425 TaxID=2570319 RepID=UPI001F186D8D|nr:class I SAM-dependent methyltransferase [Nonomuraea sp. MG754425]MCF6470678.1 class I SAM-dependent methyltransferase [Nonomuraea sp. MG754425]
MTHFYDHSFAAIYDNHFSGPVTDFARTIRGYFESISEPSERRLLDLCCGTGQLAAHFAEHGYQVVGVDASAPMLEIAARRTAEVPGGGAVRLMAADATDFDVEEPVHLVTCTGDSLNHLPDVAALRKCFSAVRRALAPGGTFVFDVHSMTGLRMQNFSTVRDMEDLLLVVKITYDPAGRRAVARVTGCRRLDETTRWERFEQDASITAWPAEEIIAALVESGFDRAWACRLNDLATPLPDPDRVPRLYFVARAT